MDYDNLIRSIIAGALFGGLLAGVYWLFRRRDPRVWSHCWKIFLALFLFMALRTYFTH